MNKLIIKANPNFSKRTFTIRRYAGRTVYAKYRTNPMSWREFSDNLNNTSEDWENFLRTQEYHKL